VAKLSILTEAYRQSEAGLRPLTDPLKSDLSRMIAVSDNEAANRLMDVLGLRNVNAAMTALGLSRTQLSNHFALANPPTGVFNRTSPADMARFMELLATDRVISPAASREIRSLLSLAGDDSKIGRGLPQSARLAHKSGWFDAVANDVGIVTHGQTTYVLAVFTEGIATAETANQTIAAVARTLHAAWGPK
jgi:beta-lactamase class A